MKLKYKTSEFFFYGKRIKVEIRMYENENNVRCYETILYTHNRKPIKRRLFFDNKLRENQYIEQNNLYIEAVKMARNYLDTCNY